MRRIIGTHLLIALLLTCPYFCLGGESIDPAGESIAVSSCTAICCGHHTEPQNESQPAPSRTPLSEDQDCLCEGAVLGDPVRMAEIELVALCVGLVEASAANNVCAVVFRDNTTSRCPLAHSPQAWCALSGQFLL